MDNKRILNRFDNNNFKLAYENNKVNVVNFTKLGTFDDTQIILYNKDKKIIISGKKLVISKLVTDEILVEGLINNIKL